MKVRISLELDLSSNPSLNIKTKEDLRGSLQNLGIFLGKLHTYNLTLVTKTLLDKSEHREYLIERAQQDSKVSDQIFNNYTVAGTTDDGHNFYFTHKEPGYVEQMVINGHIVKDY
jgi:hypothetical protein